MCCSPAWAVPSLQGTLPADAQARSRALETMVERIDALAVNLPVPVQAELSQLLGLLCTAPGRLGLAGLGPDWADATEVQVQAALESMRFSSLALRQQALPGAARNRGRCLYVR